MKIGRLGVHIGARRWCESEKVSRTTSSFDHGVMKGQSEGAKCGDYVLAERWGEINPRVELDMSGGRAINEKRTVVGVTTTRGSFRRKWQMRRRNVELREVYEVGREVRGEGAGSLK